DATRKPVYRERAEKWFRLMKSRMKTRDGGKYFVWNYWDPAGPWDYRPDGSTQHWSACIRTAATTRLMWKALWRASSTDWSSRATTSSGSLLRTGTLCGTSSSKAPNFSGLMEAS